MRFPSLQILRFVAALTVVVHHLLLHYDTDMDAPRLHWVLDFGVDIFFVISGFIIALVTERERDPVQFFAKRVARVVPTYWIFTLCVFAVGLVAPSLLSHASRSPLDLLRSLLFIPYPNPDGLYQPILFVGWTLNYEMFFYAVVAVALAVFATRRASLVAVAVVMVALSVLHFAPIPHGGVLFFYTAGIILEFAAGIALHRFFRRREFRPVPFGVALLPLGLLASVVLNQLSPEDGRAVVLGIPALLTVAGALCWRPAKTRFTAWLVLAGDASYALYLTHPFLVNGLTKLVMRRFGNGPVALAATGLAAVGLSVAVSIAVYLWLERPINRRLNGLLGLAAPRKVTLAR